MQSITANNRSLGSVTLLMILAIAATLLSTTAFASGFDRVNNRIKMAGTLVSADQAGKPNVIELVSGAQVIYYEVSKVFDNDARSALKRLPFNRIQVMGSDAAIAQLARTETCQQVVLDMNLYDASSTAAFVSVTEPSSSSWAANGSSSRTCG